MNILGKTFLGCATAVIALILLIALWLIGVSVFRPDLFRFEQVSVLSDSELLDAVDDRVSVLMSTTDSALLELPEQQVEQEVINGRPAMYVTTCTEREDGGLRIVVGAAISEARAWVGWRTGVVANGFDLGANGTRTPLSDDDRASMAIELNTDGLYER